MRFEPLALSRPQTRLRRAPFMLLAILLANLGVVRAAAPQADQWNSYLAYKSYRLRLTWTAADSWTKQEKQGDCTTTSTLDASLRAEVSLKLVRSERGHGIHALWTLEKGSKPEGSLAFSLSQQQHSICKGRPDSDFKSSLQGGGVTDGDGRFELNLKTGEYRIFGGATTTNALVTQEHKGGPTSTTQGGLTLCSTPDGIPGLPQDITGTATPGGNILQAAQPIELVPGAAGDVIGAACRQPTRFFWRLEPWEQNGDEMIFDESDEYNQWIPAARQEDMPGIALDPAEPGWKPLAVTVRIVTKKDGNTGRSGKIRFTLEDVSRSKGFCLNFPQGGQEKADLRFSDKQLPGITVTSSQADKADVAETTEAVSVATVRLESRDPAAYGTLKATCDELSLKAIYKPTNTYALAIPRDDDGNHIADAWETKKGIPHYDKDWDGESVPGQDQAGDGLTLYHEYRGAVVLDGGKKTWRRLDPAKKEMFLVDPQGAFPLAVWERVTQIKAYALDDSLVDASMHSPNGMSPLVNFNASDSSNHPVYALLVKVRSDNPSESAAPAYAEFNNPACIKNAIQINLFPTRFLSRIEEDYQWLNKAILNPDSTEASELANPPYTLPSTFPQDGKRAWSKLTLPETRKAVAAKLQTAVVLHETGHILGTPDHDNSPPAGFEFIRSCLMFNEGPWFRRGTLIYTALGQGDKDMAWPYLNFCKTSTANFNCFGVLHVKDW